VGRVWRGDLVPFGRDHARGQATAQNQHLPIRGRDAQADAAIVAVIRHQRLAVMRHWSARYPSAFSIRGRLASRHRQDTVFEILREVLLAGFGFTGDDAHAALLIEMLSSQRQAAISSAPAPRDASPGYIIRAPLGLWNGSVRPRTFWPPMASCVSLTRRSPA